jgi:hypothetical protein
MSRRGLSLPGGAAGAAGLLLLLAACGQDQQASLSLQVRWSSAVPGAAPALRGIDLLHPPDRILVEVDRSSALVGDPVVFEDFAWADLEIDPGSGHPYLLVSVPVNEGSNDPYLLRLAGLVTNAQTQQLEVAECGVIGQIFTSKGAKVRLTLQTHPGDCTPLCRRDADCAGSRYCLSFECQDSLVCVNSANCPSGAYCSNLGTCSGSCVEDQDLCPLPYGCCGEICSANCPDAI